MSRSRRPRPRRIGEANQALDRGSRPDEEAQGHECLEVLRPVFQDVVSVIDPSEAWLLRTVLLDGVSNQDVARSLGVHKSTVTRQRRKACEKLAARFRVLEERDGGSDRTECLAWLLATFPAARHALGETLAESIRR